MPLYQYRCRACGHELEARQKFSEDPLSECPNCGAPNGLYRVVQAAGIVFKGSGFYITDSKGSTENLTGSGKKDTKDTKVTKDAKESKSKPESSASAAD
ncbi:MAG: FmdB family zinc ribbon protein [Anaerolineales bacterium]